MSEPASKFLTDDFKATPYWWDAAPLAERSNSELPTDCDIAIVGSGYTGLCAAIELAANGRRVVVLDSQQPGAGCSTRNGGQISSSIKPGYQALKKRYGAQTAASIMNAGHQGLFWIEDFINQHEIDCSFTRCGRFFGAHTRSVYESLGKKLVDQPPGVTLNADIVPLAEQGTYIQSDQYHGGIIYHDHCSLDPGRYHQGLLKKAEMLGVTIVGNAKVDALDTGLSGGDTASRVRVATSKGSLLAKDVIVATNGYSDGLFPWARRRVIPIGSYMIATEELPQSTVERLIPASRVITDSRKLVVYYRPSPDNKRILFGARVSMSESDPLKTVPAMHKQLAMRFPELSSVKISHSWMGFVAYTFDELPHFGKHEGIHYAMGYCGSGVSLSSYSGVQVARLLMGQEGDTAFEQPEFEKRFYYRKHPWFLAPSIAWYKFKDAFVS